MESELSTRRRSRGFTLIELLIVVAIIGVISAVALPQLFWALQKARQARSTADMRSLAQTIEIYFQDVAIYPRLGNTDAYQLVPHLSPYIMQILPIRDGWNQLFRYQGPDGFGYTLVSYASNRLPDLPYIYGPTRRYREDIVLHNGTFIQWPEGKQSP